MDDSEVLHRIEALVAEEHRLRESEEAGHTGPNQRARIEQIEVSLDRAWDLLRQRRAMRDRRENPDDALERPASVVEKYEQ
jgi:hypothetical protein